MKKSHVSFKEKMEQRRKSQKHSSENVKTAPIDQTQHTNSQVQDDIINPQYPENVLSTIDQFTDAVSNHEQTLSEPDPIIISISEIPIQKKTEPEKQMPDQSKDRKQYSTSEPGPSQEKSSGRSPDDFLRLGKDLRKLLKRYPNWELNVTEKGDFRIMDKLNQEKHKKRDQELQTKERPNTATHTKQDQIKATDLPPLWLSFKNAKGKDINYNARDVLSEEDMTGLNTPDIKALYRKRMIKDKGALWVKLSLM